MTEADALHSLQTWYLNQCEHEWADRYGVHLETLDNPGWSLAIDLAETDTADRNFEPMEQHRSEDDWLVCRLEGAGDTLRWCAYCGPLNLSEVLGVFAAWVEHDAGRS